MKKLLRAVYQKIATPILRNKAYQKEICGVIYRRLSVDDLLVLRGLCKSILPGEEKDVMYGLYSDSKLQRLLQNRVVIGAFDKELMGAVFLSVHAPKTLEMGIFVRPNRRGKGLAKELSFRAIEFSKSIGMRRLYLRTRLDRIVNYYDKMGFSVLGKDKYMTFMRGELYGRNRVH